MRVKEAVTKVNMRTVREAGGKKSLHFFLGLRPRLAPHFAQRLARVCCQKYHLATGAACGEC